MDGEELVPVDHYWCSDLQWITRHFSEYLDWAVGTHSEPAWWCRSAQDDLGTCLECMHQFHILLEDHLHSCSPVEKRALFDFDCKRIIIALSESVRRLKQSIEENSQDNKNEDEDDNIFFMSQDESVLQSHVMIPLREILMYPKYMFHREVGKKVAEAILLLVASETTFAVMEKLPGVYLLLVHPVKEVQLWSVNKVKALGLVTVDEYEEELEDAVQWVLSVMEYGPLGSVARASNPKTTGKIRLSGVWDKSLPTLLPSHLFSLDYPKSYWLGLCMLLKSLEGKILRTKLLDLQKDCVVDSIVWGLRSSLLSDEEDEDDSNDDSTQLEKMADKVSGDILDLCGGSQDASQNSLFSSTSSYWPALQCLIALLDRLEGQLWEHCSWSCKEVVEVITTNKHYEAEVQKWLNKSQNLQSSNVESGSEMLQDSSIFTCSQVVYNWESSRIKQICSRRGDSQRMHEEVFQWLEPFTLSVIKSEKFPCKDKPAAIGIVLSHVLPLCKEAIRKSVSLSKGHLDFCDLCDFAAKLLVYIFRIQLILQQAKLLSLLPVEYLRPTFDLAARVVMSAAEKASLQTLKAGKNFTMRGSSYPECTVPACRLVSDVLAGQVGSGDTVRMLGALCSRVMLVSTRSAFTGYLTPRPMSILSPGLMHLRRGVLSSDVKGGDSFNNLLELGTKGLLKMIYNAWNITGLDLELEKSFIDDKDQLFGRDKAGTSRSVYHKSEDLSNDDSELEHLSTLSMYAVRFGDSSPPVLPTKSLKRVKEFPLVEQDDGRTSGAQESPSLFSDTESLASTDARSGPEIMDETEGPLDEIGPLMKTSSVSVGFKPVATSLDDSQKDETKVKENTTKSTLMKTKMAAAVVISQTSKHSTSCTTFAHTKTVTSVNSKAPSSTTTSPSSSNSVSRLALKTPYVSTNNRKSALSSTSTTSRTPTKAKRTVILWSSDSDDSDFASTTPNRLKSKSCSSDKVNTISSSSSSTGGGLARRKLPVKQKKSPNSEDLQRKIKPQGESPILEELVSVIKSSEAVVLVDKLSYDQLLHANMMPPHRIHSFQAVPNCTAAQKAKDMYAYLGSDDSTDTISEDDNVKELIAKQAAKKGAPYFSMKPKRKLPHKNSSKPPLKSPSTKLSKGSLSQSTIKNLITEASEDSSSTESLIQECDSSDDGSSSFELCGPVLKKSTTLKPTSVSERARPSYSTKEHTKLGKRQKERNRPNRSSNGKSECVYELSPTQLQQDATFADSSVDSCNVAKSMTCCNKSQLASLDVQKRGILNKSSALSEIMDKNQHLLEPENCNISGEPSVSSVTELSQRNTSGGVEEPGSVNRQEAMEENIHDFTLSRDDMIDFDNFDEGNDDIMDTSILWKKREIPATAKSTLPKKQHDPKASLRASSPAAVSTPSGAILNTASASTSAFRVHRNMFQSTLNLEVDNLEFDAIQKRGVKVHQTVPRSSVCTERASPPTIHASEHSYQPTDRVCSSLALSHAGRSSSSAAITSFIGQTPSTIARCVSKTSSTSRHVDKTSPNGGDVLVSSGSKLHPPSITWGDSGWSSEGVLQPSRKNISKPNLPFLSPFGDITKQATCISATKHPHVQRASDDNQKAISPLERSARPPSLPSRKQKVEKHSRSLPLTRMDKKQNSVEKPSTNKGVPSSISPTLVDDKVPFTSRPTVSSGKQSTAERTIAGEFRPPSGVPTTSGAKSLQSGAKRSPRVTVDFSSDSSEDDTAAKQATASLSHLLKDKRLLLGDKTSKKKVTAESKRPPTKPPPVAVGAPFSRARAPVYSKNTSSLPRAKKIKVGDSASTDKLPLEKIMDAMQPNKDDIGRPQSPDEVRPQVQAKKQPVLPAVEMNVNPRPTHNLDELLSILLSWSADMFLFPPQSADGKIIPPSPESVGIPVNSLPPSLPLSFTSDTDYFNAYAPLFLLELLDTVYSEVRTSDTKPPLLHCTVDEISHNDGLLEEFRCYAYVPQKVISDYAHPVERDLVVIGISDPRARGSGADGEGVPGIWGATETGAAGEGVVSDMCYGRVFGLVDKTRISRATTVQVNGGREGANGTFSSDPSTASMALSLTVKVHSNSVLYLREGAWLEVGVVMTMSTFLRQWSGLTNMCKSRLAAQILRPLGGKYFAHSPASTNTESTDGKDATFLLNGESYNYPQYSAIRSAVKCACEPFTIPRVTMLQGPPGTGKTKTILGFIHHFFETYKNSAAKSVNKRQCIPGVNDAKEEGPHLLVCAPSNAGVDEIVDRVVRAGLVEGTQQWKERNEKVSSGVLKPKDSNVEPNKMSVIARRGLRVVRVGRKSKIRTHVLPFHLDQIAEKRITDEQNRMRMEEKALEAKLQDMKRDPQSSTKEDERTNSIKKLQNQLNALRKGRSSSRNKDSFMRRKVLQGADVVFCTLSSSASTDMDECFLGNPLHFTCTVVDEAAQCCEVDVLIPLRFGSSKVVLVGDHMQLPATVRSQQAKSFGYDRSLFERIHMHFNAELGTASPVQMLKVQYRMLEEICSFPSHQFYGGNLKTAHCVGTRSRPGLCPFVVFDVQGGKEGRQGSSLSNHAECSMVYELCHTIKQVVPDDSIGIITPYKAQERLLRQKLQALRGIEIGTVDSFQGREKNVIILSCVRAKAFEGSIGFLSNQKRMNVALTRAKFGLYIVCHKNTLMVNQAWNELMTHAVSNKVCVSVLPDRKPEVYSGKVLLPRNTIVPTITEVSKGKHTRPDGGHNLEKNQSHPSGKAPQRETTVESHPVLTSATSNFTSIDATKEQDKSQKHLSSSDVPGQSGKTEPHTNIHHHPIVPAVGYNSKSTVEECSKCPTESGKVARYSSNINQTVKSTSRDMDSGRVFSRGMDSGRVSFRGVDSGRVLSRGVNSGCVSFTGPDNECAPMKSVDSVCVRPSGGENHSTYQPSVAGMRENRTCGSSTSVGSVSYTDRPHVQLTGNPSRPSDPRRRSRHPNHPSHSSSACPPLERTNHRSSAYPSRERSDHRSHSPHHPPTAVLSSAPVSHYTPIAPESSRSKQVVPAADTSTTAILHAPPRTAIPTSVGRNPLHSATGVCAHVPTHPQLSTGPSQPGYLSNLGFNPGQRQRVAHANVGGFPPIRRPAPLIDPPGVVNYNKRTRTARDIALRGFKGRRH